ncbi:MAG: iron-containing alcohol dehydrogenase, partial [Clostridia bacterium]
LSLIPHYAVLDPSLTLKLPKHITSTTGMDALTHAVEAYIGRSNTKATREMALKATKLIFANLKKVYDDGSDIIARSDMQLASYYAGAAFTRAYVGYVHGIAHSLGGLYGTPHGLANAVILPYVLDAYAGAIYRQLAELADAAGIAKNLESDKAKAETFIAAIRTMNEEMGIPSAIKELKKEDYGIITKRVLAESNPFYPVPVLWDEEDIIAILDKIRTETLN